MYVLIAPGLIYFLLFQYVPLLGNVIAFQDYSPFLGIKGSPWSGWSNFTALVTDSEAITALKNTLVLALLQIVFAFPAPLLLALLLNSLLSDRIKRIVQAVVYLPHFLSWVIVISIWQDILGGTGAFAQAMAAIGIPGVNVMADPSTFPVLVTAQVIWKDVGWGTIIFFAALVNMPQDLYECAAIDGAGPGRRLWHVTLPGLIPVTLLLLVLRLGSVLSVGFEQLLLQQPSVGASAAEVLDTFAYYRGILGGDWGIATAAGLMKGIVGTILVLLANRAAKKFGTEGLF